jgi:glycosyltransferase involved in cell wall biosynthesis
VNQFARLKGKRICRTATVPFYLVAHLKPQIEFCVKIGMQVWIVTSDGPERKEIAGNRGLQYHCIEIPRTIHPLKDLVALVKLYRFFKKNRFDIVHSTTPKAGLLSAIASFLARVPLRLHTWTGQQWVTMHGWVRTVSRMADWMIGKLNTHCYADSDSQRRFLIAEGIVPEGKISVLGHGSRGGGDVTRFNPDRWSAVNKRHILEELSISPNSTTIIFVGRISVDKGVLELIYAFETLLRKGYDINLVMVGPFDQDRGGKKTVNVDDLQRNDRIHLVGYTAEPERYLSIGDIFCLPSYREGFGSVVIEAAAMNIPTIGTKINGLVDAVEDGKSGLLVPPRDKMALTNALQRLLDDPLMVQQMGSYAKHRCHQYFSLDRVNHAQATEYERLFKQYR